MKTHRFGGTTTTGQARGIAVALAVGAIALLTGGCHPQGSTTAEGIGGVFVLQAVDGVALPARLKHGGATLEVRSGSMTFEANGTCVSRTSFVPPSGVEVKREVTADYVQDGTRLRMTWHGAGRTSGSLDGDTFTMNNEGMVFTYHR